MTAITGSSGQTAIQPIQQALQPLQAELQGASQQAADLAARIGPAYKLDLSGRTEDQDWNDPQIRQMKRMNQIECKTCKARQYHDVSNDPGVSFKTPTHLSPGSEAAAVSAHEQEHVGNEQAKASSEGRRVVSQSVSIFTSVCPECGRAFVSGGLTSTTTAGETPVAAQQATPAGENGESESDNRETHKAAS